MKRVLLLTLLVTGAAACGDDGKSADGPDAGSPDVTAEDTGGDSGTESDATDVGVDTDVEADTSAPVAVMAEAGESRYAYVNEEIILDGSATTGAAAFAWDFGDGTDTGEPSADARTATVSYSAPGRYRVTLTAVGVDGSSRTDGLVVTVTPEDLFAPNQSSTIAILEDGRVAVVVPDADQIAVISGGQGAWTRTSIDTCSHPRSVAANGSYLAVTCQWSDQIEFFGVDSLESFATVDFQYGSRPYGVILHDGVAWVALQGTGELVRLPIDTREAIQTWEIVDDARGVSLLPDGTIAVTRWRSPDRRGLVALLDPGEGSRSELELSFSERESSDTETGGVPNYLTHVAASPWGDRVAIPALQANIDQGLFSNGDELTHETTVRAIVSYASVGAREDDYAERKQFDDRGLAAAALYNPRGDFLYLAMRGSRVVERIDALNGAQAGSLLDAGFAPQGLAISDDGRWLFVDAFASREVVIYDLEDAQNPLPATRVPTVDSEPLGDAIARGQVLFNDSFDTRIARDSYIACAHCHLDGEADRLTWDFTDRGEGMRSTISLLGRAATAHGPIHWSGNFDEAQDFEHDMRGPFGGTGMVDDESFFSEGRDHPLGPPLAGLDEDLDALAAYMASLDRYPRSPYRTVDGELTEAAQRGRTLFESEETGCTSCHSGPHLTDSQWLDLATPLVHDVGTLSESTGGRLGGEIDGIDTPTLHALWNSPPYLHDGRAQTLDAVLTTHNPTDEHGATSELTDEELSDLTEYIQSLDGSVE